MASKTVKLPLGVTSTHYAREQKLAQGGKVIAKAREIALSRGDRLVWVEQILMAQGRTPAQAADEGKKIRARLARARTKARAATKPVAKKAAKPRAKATKPATPAKA